MEKEATRWDPQLPNGLATEGSDKDYPSHCLLYWKSRVNCGYATVRYLRRAAPSGWSMRIVGH